MTAELVIALAISGMVTFFCLGMAEVFNASEKRD